MPALPQPSEPSSRLWPYDSTRREKVVPSAFQISYFGASATQVTQINNNMEQNEEKKKKKKKSEKPSTPTIAPHLLLIYHLTHRKGARSISQKA
jgi:hypothetical protein